MLSSTDLLLRLTLAAVLGSIVGYERERREWGAGLRDHMLVCLGSALFMVVSSYGFSGVIGDKVVLDPSRIAAQVVTGIGFLGAGTILVRGEVIRGLTTAASLWVVAAIGLAAGSGLHLAAIIATGLLLLILAGVKPLERHLFPQHRTYDLVLRMRGGTLDLGAIEKVLADASAELVTLTIAGSAAAVDRLVTISMRKPRGGDVAPLIAALQRIPGVAALEVRSTAPDRPGAAG